MRVPIGLTCRTVLTAIFAIFIVIVPNKAVADATMFVGTNTMTPHGWARGFSAGLTLLNLGFEVEYANAGEDKSQRSPGLQTGMVNVLVQTPMPSNGFQFYATTGGGLYRERLTDVQETHVGLNAGGGLKITRACKPSRNIEVADCGHWVMVEHQRMFNAACLDFLVND